MKPRRILIFSHAYYPRLVGGAELAVKEITHRISPNEIEFDMITLNAGGELAHEKIGNVNVCRIGNELNTFSKLFFPYAASKKAKKLNSINKYDATWAIMASYAGFAAYLFKKNAKNIPFILTIQEGEHFTIRKIFKPVFSLIFKSADKVQVISNYLSVWAKEMGARAQIKVVPNGVNYDLFSKKPSKVEAVSLKQKLNKKSDDIFLITTSRLVPKNAVDDIIRSLQYLPENIKLLILGAGPQEKILRSLVSSLKLENRVNFLGYIPHKDMPPYLHVSDIFIRPSLTEGFGSSFIEAMAAGLPVIATNVGGIPDFLIDCQTGLFCEVRNPKSIAQKVLKISKDRESRDFIVRNATKMVQDKYQWNQVAEMMKKVLD